MAKERRNDQRPDRDEWRSDEKRWPQPGQRSYRDNDSREYYESQHSSHSSRDHSGLKVMRQRNDEYDGFNPHVDYSRRSQHS